MRAIVTRINLRLQQLPSGVRQDVLAGLVLLAALLVFFHAALPNDRVLSPAGIVFDTPLFASSAPEERESGRNALLFDQVYQFTPWRTFARDELLDGRLPLWNPYSSAGTPLVATMQSAVFYPINLSLLPFEIERALLLSAVLRLWLAGMGVYLLARRYALELVPALISAVAFMLSAYLVVWLGHPHSNVAIWLPWLVLCTELLANTSTLRSTVRATAVLGLVTGAVLSGGHAETELYVLLTAAGYGALRCLQARTSRDWTASMKRAAFIGCGLLLGAGIAAVQLLPFLEWLPLSAEYGRRAERDVDLLSLQFVKELPSLLTGVFPNAYGNPTWEASYWSFNPWSSVNEGALYIGVIPLVLALIAIGTCWRNSLVRIWTGIGGLALALALQLPIIDILNQLPPLSLANSGRLRLIAAFSLSLLAGFGAQALASRKTPRISRATTIGFATVAIIGLALLIGTQIVVPRLETTISTALERRIDHMVGNGEALPRSFALCQGRMPACLDEIETAYRMSNVELYLPALIALAAVLILRCGRARLILPGLLALTIIDLIGAGSGYNPTLDRDHFYPEPPLVIEANAARANGRVAILQQIAYPDVQMMYDLPEVRGLDYPLLWYSDYLDATGDRIPWIANGVLLRTVASPLTRALGIEYVITTEGELPWAGPGLIEVARDGELILARVPNALPRGFLVTAAIVAQNDDEALALLMSDPETIQSRVVLTETPANAGLLGADGANPPTSDAELLIDEPSRQLWRVETVEPSLLVVMDTYYPGWRATIDGEPLDILRANLAFRSVEIPPGEHEIEFRYEPRSVRAGLWISAISLATALALLAVSWLPWSWRAKLRS